MKFLKLVWCVSVMVISGCTTSFQLESNTLHQGKSLTELEYEMVLDNIAMLQDSPGALPWHAIISKGSITVNDAVTPSAGYKGGPPVRTIGISASRAWQGDWTFTPVIDPTVLNKLRDVYGKAAKADWVHSGYSVPKSSGFSGHHGTRFVWVEKANMKQLAETTLDVLTAATSVTAPWLAFNSEQVFPFIQKLQSSPTNGDLVSKFLGDQLPSGVKGLVQSYTNTMKSAETAFWLKEALESGLNKTVAGWTTNEVYELAANIQMTTPGKVSNELKKTLRDPVQSNDLLQKVILQLADYYPEVFRVQTNTYSLPLQMNTLLIPGGVAPILR